MIRISATQIEAFRRILQTDYSDEKELIAQIMGKPFEPNHAMQTGTAWHAILEKPVEHIWEEGGYKSGYMHFRAFDVDRAIAFIGPGVWEVKATKVYETWGEKVAVVAQADHVHGKVITDNKLSLSGLDLKRYEPCLQWRLYLDVHQADKFIYNRWHFNEPDPCVFALKEAMTVPFYRYPELERDCKTWIAQFLDWAQEKHLLHYLEREGSSITSESAT